MKTLNFIKKIKYKPNYHRRTFTKITGSRFKAGHFTKCTFRNVIFNNDFIGVNLKGSNFKNAQISNCFFLHCDFSKSDFGNCTFNSVYFCACKFTDCKEINRVPKQMIYKNTNYMNISQTLNSFVLSNLANKRIEKNRILTISASKINSWAICILLLSFSEQTLLAFFNHIVKKNPNAFRTLFDYKFSIEYFLNKS